MEISKLRAVNIDFFDGSGIYFRRDRLGQPFQRTDVSERAGKVSQLKKTDEEWVQHYANVTTLFVLGTVKGYE